MNAPRLRVLCVGVAAEPALAFRFDLAVAATSVEARDLIATQGAAFDALLLAADPDGAEAADLDALAGRAARIVVVADADAEPAAAWLQHGADDVVAFDELSAAATGRRILFAVLRRRHATGRLAAWSTDPGTGLPHRQQFVEHLSQLLALREREPSPMAVLVLRIEWPVLGGGGDGEASSALRRKLAVRLRAGLRSSDVVAALDGDGFAVLLGSILAVGDAERVAEKLVAALVAPLSLAGSERSVAVAVGIGSYPQDGNDAEKLLRRASALAAAAPASGPAGQATAHDASGAVRVAANDDT